MLNLDFANLRFADSKRNRLAHGEASLHRSSIADHNFYEAMVAETDASLAGNESSSA